MKIEDNQKIFTAQFSSELYEKDWKVKINGVETTIEPENIAKNGITIGATSKPGETIEEKNKYIQIIFSEPVIKLGYSCSPNGIGENNKIQLLINADTWETFEIGKTGMFEFQAEEITISDEEIGLLEKNAIIHIYGVRVPMYSSSTIEENEVTINENSEKIIKLVTKTVLNKVRFIVDYSYLKFDF